MWVYEEIACDCGKSFLPDAMFVCTVVRSRRMASRYVHCTFLSLVVDCCPFQNCYGTIVSCHLPQYIR